MVEVSGLRHDFDLSVITSRIGATAPFFLVSTLVNLHQSADPSCIVESPATLSNPSTKASSSLLAHHHLKLVCDPRPSLVLLQLVHYSEELVPNVCRHTILSFQTFAALPFCILPNVV